MAAPVGEDPNPTHGEPANWSAVYNAVAEYYQISRSAAKDHILQLRQADVGRPKERPASDDRFGEDLRRFIDAMVYKLRKNNHKGRWEELDLRATLSLLRKEVDELEDAIKDGNRIEIELEAADVANFAMMVSAIAIERGK